MHWFQKIFSHMRHTTGERAHSLHIKLFTFFILFAVVLAGSIFLVLTLTGVFNAAEQRHTAWLEREITLLQRRISGDFDKLSLSGVSLARTLAQDINVWVRKNGIAEHTIAENPELLETLLAEQARTVLSVLTNTTCSGVFIILDATVNPSAENAAYSKAGIFFTRTNPSSISSIVSKIHCLRGPASIARANGVELIGQWRMEFNAGEMYFFQKVLETAKASGGTDLSRLFYWTGRYVMAGNSEHSMMLCVPLIAPDGAVYGICGIEMGAMLFKRLYSPDNTEYPRVFTAFMPVDGSGFDARAGLIAGNTYLTSQTTGLLTPEKTRGMDTWRSSGDLYAGRSRPIRLYPPGSPYGDERWELALLMPYADWSGKVARGGAVFYGAVIALLAVSLLAAVYISRRYIKPVMAALENLKSDGTLRKTKIAEVDHFLAYLAALAEERKASGEEKENADTGTPQSAEFSPENIQSYAFEKLSSKEIRVAELSLRGYSYTEIAEIMELQPNTVKWHQKNLYTKLQINSKRELFALAEKRSRMVKTIPYPGNAKRPTQTKMG